MIHPKKAAVRPRILSPISGDALPLDEEIASLLEQGITGQVALIGPPGSGKTTALRHLAAVLPKQKNLILFDSIHFDIPPFANANQLTVFTATDAPTWAYRGVYRLAPWQRDDVIEYLLTTHPQRVSRLISHVQGDGWQRLGGSPELWQFVLEEIAKNDNISTFREALQAFLTSHVNKRKLPVLFRVCLFQYIEQGYDFHRGLLHCRIKDVVQRVMRHAPVHELLASELLATDLREGTCEYLQRPLPRAIIRTVAELMAGDDVGLENLRRMMTDTPAAQPMAASLLHAADPSWRPEGPQPPCLTGAYLDGVKWPAVRLLGANLKSADLSDADLQRADLTSATLAVANLERADLREAVLCECKATQARFVGARLNRVIATGAHFLNADLENADLEDAHLVGAILGGANLKGASLRGADLTGASLNSARIEEACFAGATLHQTDLSGLKLREADLAGADLAHAIMTTCDLEGMSLPGANFEGANLQGALLTGTAMQVANFANANLQNAGLADIDWEGVDLRGANLTGASFHAGSSRSGLVGSPIACEGSKMGFYTDEYDEQTHKAPEEIRKANLCLADLRGAVLEGVDFYLVDLRGARFDPEHEPHLRRSGAILEARV